MFQSALLWLWISLAEGLYGNLCHLLRLHRAVAVVSADCCDLIYGIHTLDYLAESSIGTV